jgi:large repetitive protein
MIRFSPRSFVASTKRTLGRRAVGTSAIVALVASLLVVLAVRAEGAKATNVRLNDGTVWVANDGLQQLGRLNLEVNELDLFIRSATNPDVIQDGRTVLFTGAAGGVQSVDVVAGAPTLAKNTINFSDYKIGGGIGTVFDSASGKLWIGSAESIVAADYPKKAHAKIAPGSRILLTDAASGRVTRTGNRIGRVLVVQKDSWYELALDDSLQPVRAAPAVTASGSSTTPPTTAVKDDTAPEPDPEPLAAPVLHPLTTPIDEKTMVTLVGDRLVFLNPDGTLWSEKGKSAKIPGAKPVLQQPGAMRSSVLVASATGLFEVAIGSDKVTQLATASGIPAAPVRVGFCTYGAWSGTKPVWFKSSCKGRPSVDVTEVPASKTDGDLVFRVNGENVALNAKGDGETWAEHDGRLTSVGNWDDAQTDKTDDTDTSTGKGTRVTERRCIDGGADAPVAGADPRVGVRPRQSIIDVLYNDDDANCEPIAIDSVEPSGGPWGQLTIIDNGQHILYSPSQATATAAGTSLQPFSFSYIVTDPGGHKSAPARVDVVVKDLSVGNSPPALRPKNDGATRKMRTVVEEGHAVSYNVMADWWDPDGDDLRLASAAPEARGEASGTADGVVRYAALGVSAGINNVLVSLSDGQLSGTEPLEVTVKPAGTPIAPITANDFITLVEGASGVVKPLANDSDPNENTLSLKPTWAQTQPPATGYRTEITDGDTVRITAVAAGTYALNYEAWDGTDGGKGAIRLRVVKPEGDNRAPVAVPDQVKLRADRVVNVDVLANDIDADGDLLAVVNASASTSTLGGVVRASVIDRRLVQIEVVPGPDGQPPTGPFFVSYTIEDGHAGERALKQDEASKIADSIRSTGSVTVLIQPPASDQSPIAASDSAVVRTGDIVSIPVLANDLDPDGDPIVLKSVDAAQSSAMETAGDGVAWAQGRSVYFRGGKPGRKSLQYSILANGKEATGEVSVEVRALPDATNPDQSPSPIPLVLRAVRDGVVRLPVPLFGADPDGDSITLLDRFDGLKGAVQGNKVSLDPDNPGVLLFAASAGSGPSDEFRYTVQDPFGQTGTGLVHVVIIDNKGWAPQAHDDVFRGKPGRTMSIPVLANDTSPSDSKLELAEMPFFDKDGKPTTAPSHPDAVKILDQSNSATRGRIEVTVPPVGTTTSEHYRISDGQHPGDAFVRVTADELAPNMPPVAQIDILKEEDVRGKQEVDVRVLNNDFDPDEADSPLLVTLPALQNGTVKDGVVTVPLTKVAQTVLYRITDADKGVAVGIIRIPGLENHPPVLSADGKNPELRVIEAGSSAPLTINLPDIVEDPDKDPDIKLTPTEIVVLGGIGQISRAPGDDGFVYTPPPNLQQPTRATIQFEVTDRPATTPAERQLPTCLCLATLAVDIVLKASSPPRILSQGAVQVPQLKETVTYDLGPLVVDDQEDALDFTIDPTSFGGLNVTQSGSSITLISEKAGDSRIPVGTNIPIRFTVTDRKFPAVQGTVNVTMVATNKGRPAVGSIPEQKAERSVPLTLPNLIKPATNPFGEGADVALKLTASSVDGGATLTCTPSGDCQFNSNKVGTFHVSYTLTDAVGQTVTGSVTAVVKGKPLAPGIPAISSVGDHTVKLTWSVPGDMLQGGALKTYHVTAVEAGKTMDFTSPGGEFTGLTNGTTYHFTVTAENELGLGVSSEKSSGAIPDRVPDPPIGAAFTDYGDGTLMLKWAPPATAADFTAIQKYEVSIGGQNITTDGGTTTLTVATGLTNGTGYTFKVRAQNKATTNGGWGDWSGPSATTEKPSRFPDPPTGVVATSVGDGGSPRLTVKWSAPAFDGGRPIKDYKVCLVQAPGTCQTITTGLQATFDLNRNLASSFTVIANNTDIHKSDSLPSAASAPVTTVGTPDAPVISGVVSQNHALTATASSANNSGCSSMSIEYSINGGASWQTGGTFSGLTNGQPYNVVARAKLASTCGTSGVVYVSGNSATGSSTPYGPLVQPTMNSQATGSVIRWDWSTNRQDDGRPDWNASLSGSCAGASVAGGSYSQDFGQTGQTYACAITISATGVPSLSASSSKPVPSPPPPVLSLSITENPFICNNTSHKLGTLSGANPGETITFFSSGVSGLLPGVASAGGTLGLIWDCAPAEKGTTWTLTATGSSSGRSGSASFSGG